MLGVSEHEGRNCAMTFTKIDLELWPRKEYFDHYFKETPCTYSAVFRLDITKLRRRGEKLYPGMLHAIAAVVNNHQEFRMACTKTGEVGFYDIVHPSYTIFHRDTETFSNLWTEYTADYRLFYKAYQQDMEIYGNRQGFMPKPGMPENTFPVSMLPWASFEGFNLNLQNGYNYLPPIFTIGKFQEENGKTVLPLVVQVHHAVCDGFHLCRLVNELQEILNQAKSERLG